MDRQKAKNLMAHGSVRWMAARLKPVVKKRGVQKDKKPKHER